MPAQLSKFSIPTTCKDYVHPWTNSCISATAGLGLHALQECFRIYSTVYFITLLMKGKVPSKNDVKRTILGIFQSTAFLSWSAFTYPMFLCLLRRMLGNFNILTISFLPSFLSSLAAIVIERPSRRTLLSLYVSNIATETLFKMGVWRGYFSAIPRGEIYIFAASMAMLLYFFRSKGNKDDSVFKIIRFIFGRYEEFNYQKTQSVGLENLQEPVPSTSKSIYGRHEYNNIKRSNDRAFKIAWEALKVYENIIGRLKAQSKHPTCPHPYSCVHYVLTGGARLFGYGICAQLALKLIFQVKRLLKRPKLMKAIIFRRDNLYLATFLGGFTGMYRLMSCLLRRSFDNDSQYYAIPAGLVASIAFMMYPDNTIALYVMWKTLQLLWNSGVENGKVPEVKWFVIVLYCFSTAVLFHAAIIEPQNLRQSYFKFLHTISGGRIATMARLPLDEFGLDSSISLQEVLRKTRTTDKNVYSF